MLLYLALASLLLKLQQQDVLSIQAFYLGETSIL